MVVIVRTVGIFRNNLECWKWKLEVCDNLTIIDWIICVAISIILTFQTIKCSPGHLAQHDAPLKDGVGVHHMPT